LRWKDGKPLQRLAVLLVFGLLTNSTTLWAQAPEPRPLEPVTVTATRVAQPSFNVPASIDRVALDAPVLGASLAESLQGVPGLLARDRQNYAQDTQISIRGFGARSPFGIRGLRLYLDGIPATQPDGQGQISHFNLATADHVEVLRGPFSALYGNSSGGVIQVFTADAPAVPTLGVDRFLGSNGNQRWSVTAAGYGATLGYTDFRTDGYRDHSAAERRSFNGKLTLPVGENRKLTLLVNHLDAPDAQDPLGLSRAQFDQNPQQATAVATQFNTRKSVRQSQLGAVYAQSFGAAGNLQLLGYGGQRTIEQYLAIPISTQGNPRHSGGVVALATDYAGADARWSQKREAFTWVVGVSADTLDQHRLGYENFVGTVTGVRGALRRDELNTVSSVDEYAQLDWTLTPRTSVLAGLRHSTVQFRSSDRYLRTGNPDDSGAVAYSATTPVVGILFKQSRWLHGYAAYGSGFETPTFAELAYRPDGQAGLNFGLAPARSRNAEAGLKLNLENRSQINLAVFHIDARDELVTVNNTGGRASYSNAARTLRQGLELSLQSPLSHTLDLALAYTLLDATVRQGYSTCASLPCTTPQVAVARGAHLPGVAQGQWFSRLRYTPQPAWQLSAEFRYLDAVPVNDSNSESAPSYGVADAETAYRFRLGTQSLRVSLRVENLLDTHYVGSVIVNDSNGRYYEPAPGRSVLAGVEWRLSR
jgi:iron complex outermembrane receptor protein